MMPFAYLSFVYIYEYTVPGDAQRAVVFVRIRQK